MWRQPFPGAAHNWRRLFRSVRDLVPDGAYQRGRAMPTCHDDGDRVSVVLDDGSTEEFDLLIGADGYCSTLDTGFLTVCFPRGHLVAYLMPGRDGGTGPGDRQVNWGLYGFPPPGTDLSVRSRSGRHTAGGATKAWSRPAGCSAAASSNTPPTGRTDAPGAHAELTELTSRQLPWPGAEAYPYADKFRRHPGGRPSRRRLEEAPRAKSGPAWPIPVIRPWTRSGRNG
jgi:hypothetical protein